MLRPATLCLATAFAVVLPTPALAGSKGAAYPTAWVVSDPEVASETDAVRALAGAKFAEYPVEGVAFSRDWYDVRHASGGQIVGRGARALVVLKEEAKARCLLVELVLRQDRSTDGWKPTRIYADNLQLRPASEAPAVKRILADKSWWSVILAECPAKEAPPVAPATGAPAPMEPSVTPAEARSPSSPSSPARRAATHSPYSTAPPWASTTS
jgi:hypothetical protein